MSTTCPQSVTRSPSFALFPENAVLFDDGTFLAAGLAAPEGDHPDAPPVRPASTVRRKSWWDWVSFGAWKTWGVNKVLDGILGEPEVVPFLKDRLPLSAQYLSQVVAQFTRKVVVDSSFYQLFLNYNQDGEEHQELWKAVQADQRMRATLENTALIIYANALKRVHQLVEDDPDGEFLLDMANDLIRVTSQHFKGYIRGLESFPNGGGKRAEWFALFGDDLLHPVLSGTEEDQELYAAQVTDCLLGIGLPEHGRELVHVAGFAQPEAYALCGKIIPELLTVIRKEALARHTINHLVVKVLERYNHYGHHSAGDRQPPVVRTYSKQADLNAQVGCLIRRVSESLYPRLAGTAFRFFALEEQLGNMIGAAVTYALRSISFKQLVDRAANGALAGLCDGEYVIKSHDELDFIPDFKGGDLGGSEIALTQKSSHSDKRKTAENAERLMAETLRDLLPNAVAAKWHRAWRSIDSLLQTLPLGGHLSKARRLVGSGLGAMVDLAWRVSYLGGLLGWVGLCVTRPVARNVLHLAYHSVHENLFLQLQDTILGRFQVGGDEIASGSGRSWRGEQEKGTH